MNDTLQTLIVAAVVAGAVLYLFLRGRKKHSGDGGCGCGKSGKAELNPKKWDA